MSCQLAATNPRFGFAKTFHRMWWVALIGTSLSLFIPTLLAQDSGHRLGAESYSRGEYEKAANLWLAEANEGSVDAQFNLGILYYEGKGVDRDRNESIFWFSKAAQAGHAQAQYNLGHLLVEKQQDLAQVRRGVVWWKRSAENGSILAQYNYGKALFYGLAIDQDLEQAHYWISKAARSGEGASQRFLEDHSEVFATLQHAERERFRVAEENLAREMQGGQRIVTSKQGGEVRSLDVTVKGLDDDNEGVYKKEQLGPSEDRDDQPVSVLLSDKQINDADKVGVDAGAIDLKDYVLVGKKQATLYSQGNQGAFTIGDIAPNMLLRVVGREGNWLSVQVPGGIPGWVEARSGKRLNRFFEITANPAIVHAKSNDVSGASQFGKLSYGAKLLLIDKKEGWYQVLVPEVVPVWLEVHFVQRVSAPVSQIGSVWQAQRVQRKSGIVSGYSQKSFSMDSDQVTVERVSESIASLKNQLGDYFKTGFNKLIPMLGSTVSKAPLDNDAPENIIALPGGNQENSSKELQDGDVQDDLSIEPKSYSIEGTTEAQEIGLMAKRQVVPSDQGRITDVNEFDVEGEQGAMGSEANRDGVRLDQASLQDVLQSSVDRSNDVVLRSRIKKQMYRINTDDIPLIHAPHQSGVLVERVKTNLLVDVVDMKDQWAKIRVPGGLPAWGQAEQFIVDNERAIVLGHRVKLRAVSGNDIDNPILGVVHRGLHTRYLDNSGDWIRVMTPEWITVWVDQSFLGSIKSSQYNPDILQKEWKEQGDIRKGMLE